MVHACVAMNEARGLTRKSTVQTPGIVGNGFRSFVGRVRRPDIRDSQRRRRGMSGLRTRPTGTGVAQGFSPGEHESRQDSRPPPLKRMGHPPIFAPARRENMATQAWTMPPAAAKRATLER